MTDRKEKLGHEIWTALRRLVSESLERKGADGVVERELGTLAVPLELPPEDEDGAGEAAFVQSLIDAVDQRVEDALEYSLRFRPGRAWCFRCRDVACKHAMPETSREVLVGYGPTGVPRWLDFAQWALERRHAELDRLYDGASGLIGIVREAGEADRMLLPAFREGRFRPLALAAVGFWTFADGPEDGRCALALTFLVGAIPKEDGGFRLGLNTIGRAPDGGALESLWDRRHELPWRKAVHWARAALQSIPSNGDRGKIEGRVNGILQGLVRRLQREARADERRTQHASERHASGERPTGLALRDAARMPIERWLLDERRGTLVVLGGRGRTHFFSDEGRHVSSVRYRREAIERKRTSGIWRPADVENVRRLLDRLKKN